MDVHLRPALLGRLFRVDLKMFSGEAFYREYPRCYWCVEFNDCIVCSVSQNNYKYDNSRHHATFFITWMQFTQFVNLSIFIKSKHQERSRWLYTIKQFANFRNEELVLMSYEWIGHWLCINHKKFIATGRLHWWMRTGLHQMPVYRTIPTIISTSKWYNYISMTQIHFDKDNMHKNINF